MAAPKGHPRYGGRQKGTPNKITAEAREIAQGIINRPAYRAKLVQQADNGRLNPTVESMLWHYAFGKPKEGTDLSGTLRVCWEGSSGGW